MTTPWIFGTEGKISAAPLVDEGTIFLGSWDGCLYAVEPGAFYEKWMFLTGDRIYASPVTDGSTICLASADSFLYFLDPVTGAEKGRFACEGGIRHSPVIESGTVLFGDQEGFLYAVDSQTGEESWRFECGSSVESSPVVLNGSVFVRTGKGELVGVSLADGSQVMRLEKLRGGKVFGQPETDGKHILAGGAAGLHALDPLTGNEIWSFSTYGSVKSAPVVAGETVYFGAGTHFYALDTETGASRWETLVGSAPKGAPALDGDDIFFTTWNHDVFALDATSGEVMWSFNMGQFPAAPAVASGDWLLLGSHDGNLYGFHLDAGENPASLEVPEGEIEDDYHRTYSNAQQPWRAFLLLYLVGWIYEFFWFHRNWKYMKLNGARIRPLLRTLGLFVPILNLYLKYDLFRTIRFKAQENGVANFSLAFVTTAYLTLSNLSYTLPYSWDYIRERVGPGPTPYDLLFLAVATFLAGILAITVLMKVQKTNNRLWLQRYPAYQVRSHFTGGEMAVIILFGIFQVFGLIIVAARIAEAFAA